MATIRKKLGAVARRPGALEPDPDRLRRRSDAGGAGGGDEASTPARPARSTTGCGTPTSSPPTRSAPTTSRRPTRTSRSRSPSSAGTTTGASSPPASSPATRPGRVHRPPGQVPASSSPQAAGRRWTTPLEKDGFDVDQYQEGLADLWKGQDGKRYGLPKDWDTVAMFYNKQAGRGRRLTTPTSWPDLAWNPTDGGTYEKAIAHLTVDANGVRGDEPGLRQEQGQGLRPRPRRRLRRRRRARPSGACTPAPPAGPSPTRTRGAPSTTTTSPSSSRPSTGSSA